MSNWTVKNNKIQYKGEDVIFKGVSWFGFETDNGVLFGLEKNSLDDVLQFLADNKFNAIRVPFSLEMIWSWDEQPDQEKVSGDISE